MRRPAKKKKARRLVLPADEILVRTLEYHEALETFTKLNDKLAKVATEFSLFTKEYCKGVAAYAKAKAKFLGEGPK